MIKALTVLSASCPPLRHGEPWGTRTGGARIPHALPTGVPRVPARDDEPLLEEGPGREAHVRVPPVLPGGLFHSHRATVPTWRKPIACCVSLRLGARLLKDREKTWALNYLTLLKADWEPRWTSRKDHYLLRPFLIFAFIHGTTQVLAVWHVRFFFYLNFITMHKDCGRKKQIHFISVLNTLQCAAVT